MVGAWDKRKVCSVYIIGKTHTESPAYKVGISGDVRKRLAAINDGIWLKLQVLCEFVCVTRDTALFVEQKAHKLLHAYNLRGEWFGAPFGLIYAGVAAVAEELPLYPKTAHVLCSEKWIAERTVNGRLVTLPFGRFEHASAYTYRRGVVPSWAEDGTSMSRTPIVVDVPNHVPSRRVHWHDFQGLSV